MQVAAAKAQQESYNFLSLRDKRGLCYERSRKCLCFRAEYGLRRFYRALIRLRYDFKHLLWAAVGSQALHSSVLEMVKVVGRVQFESGTWIKSF